MRSARAASGVFPAVGSGIVLLLSFILLAAQPAMLLAASNQGTGDVGGVDGDLDDSNVVTLTTKTLALVKRAFLADGTPIADGSVLPKGTLVNFMIYINNNTDVAVNDVSVQDVLNAAFTYQAGTMKVVNSVNECAGNECTGNEETAIYNAAEAAAAGTDAIDGDVVSITDTTIDIGDENVANDTLDIAAGKVWALLFTVEMQ